MPDEGKGTDGTPGPDVGEKKLFVPDTNGEPPIFQGEVYAATRSKGQIEFDPAKQGPGAILYSAYVFGFHPTEEQKVMAQVEEGAELPLFVSYIFPFHEKGTVVFGGGGGGAVSDLGSGPGAEILFYSRIRSFNKTDA